jgi:hypothetical protein
MTFSLVRTFPHHTKDESTISKIEFPTHSVHIPLISTLKAPTPTRRGRIEQIPPNIEQKRDAIDTDRFTTATHTALTEHLAADGTLAAAVIKASQQCDVGDLSLATQTFIEALSASQSRAPLPRKVEPIRPQAGRVHLKRNETTEVHKLQRAAERIRIQSILVRREGNTTAAHGNITEDIPTDLTLPPLDLVAPEERLAAASETAQKCRTRANRILDKASLRAAARAGAVRRSHLVKSRKKETRKLLATGPPARLNEVFLPDGTVSAFR